ncbi:MAG TPA: carboxypeptidase-like regulatory domain-containing protein [Bryobacteraceae bacterium]|nr:carboxypeptidase-like regulatory domain-containing protein [Bryobacteraceae bacterium]
MRFRNYLLVLAAVCLWSTNVQAQTDFSTIRGSVSDPSGSAVPGAKIALVEIETNLSREVVTTADGVYEIPYLTPGKYRLTATGVGFKTFVADNILITSRQTRRIDVTFELGAVGTEVTVSADAAVINTEGSQIAGGFNRKGFIDSPMSVSFFPQAYMLTLPNVQAQGGGWNLRFSGQPSAQISEGLDGVPSDGPVNLVQNMNDFEELQVVGANNSAEFGRVVNFSMTGKSGTNDFHGRAYYELVSSALNARGFFDTQKAANHQHHGGVNVAGPIRKNKTFFYAAYYMQRIPGSTFYNRNVPTASFRQGDFSPLLRQATPVTIKDPLTGIPFAGNIIPSSRFNGTSLKVQNGYIPAPNQGGPDAQSNNFGFLFPKTSDLYRWDSTTDRVDHKFSDKNTLFGRFTNRLTPYVLAGNFPNVGTWTRTRNHHSVVVSDTHVFSPTLVNTARWGWIRDYINDGSTVDGFTPLNGDEVVKDIGLQGVNPRGFSAQGFPQMTITGVSPLTVQPGGLNTATRNFDYSDSMTWSRGAHVLKFGAELRTFRTFSGTIPTGTYGQFNFDGSLSGNGYADFLLGLPQSSTRIDPLTQRAQRSYELGLFITDTFKVSRSLTLDYGLRWDYFGPSTYRDGLQYNWDPVTGNVIVPSSALNKISALYPTGQINVVAGQVVPNPYKRNFRPRIGAAYRINDKTVVRGGYGMYTEALGNIANIQGLGNLGGVPTSGPFQLAETYYNSLQSGQSLFSFPNPFPSGGATVPSQSIAGYPLDTRNGVIHQFNVSIERQVHDIGLRASYIGSRSNSLHYNLLTVNIPQPSLTAFSQSRRPYPQFVNAAYNYQDGKAKYDSFQVEATRKMGSFTLDAHYTLANNMANYLNLENPYNHYMWNRDQYTSRNRGVINATYALPFGKGRRLMANAPGVVDGVLGGWRMMWISIFQSGQYFSPKYSGADPSNTNTTSGLPDRIANGNLPAGSRGVTRWFDASAFTVPQPGRFGNAGVNTLEGPGISVQHLSVMKEFRITERWRLEYQAMFLDLFNTPTFNFPNLDISVPGQVARLFSLQGAGGDPGYSASRTVTMRLRISF